MKTNKVPFDIYIPAIEHRAAVKVDNIRIEVITDAHGNEMVTSESSILIDKTQARYLIFIHVSRSPGFFLRSADFSRRVLSPFSPLPQVSRSKHAD